MVFPVNLWCCENRAKSNTQVASIRLACWFHCRLEIGDNNRLRNRRCDRVPFRARLKVPSFPWLGGDFEVKGDFLNKRTGSSD
jgi:hypothetical protein